MNQKNSVLLEMILKNIVIFGSFLIVLVPVVVVPASYFPYIIQKTNILKILIQIVVAAYLPLALWKSEYRPKKTIILWAVLAFAGVMLLTTFTSQSVYRSWWGNWERSFGTFTYLHYFAWFTALAGVFNKPKHWFKILNFTLIVSLLISIYSLAQRLGLSTFESGLERVNGTMGNASFLASYMLAHVFIALLFLVEKISWRPRLWYLLIFVFDMLVLQLTATRGAQLGLFAALLLFVALVFTLKAWDRKAVKVITFGIIGLFILVGVAFAFKNEPIVKQNYWLTRLTTVSLNDNTVQTRLHSWRWGLKGFRDNFIFGVGPENYQIVFNRYFEPVFYKFSPTEIWFDRAHNTLVDMAATMGIFGLLSYLGIIWAIFYALTMLYKRQKIAKLSFMVLTLLFFAYFVQNLAVFDSLNNLIVFYLLLAYLSYLSVAGPTEQKIESAGQGFIRINPLITLGLVLIMFLALFWQVDLRQIKENNYVYDAYIDSKYGEYSKSMAGFDKTYAIANNKIDPAILRSTAIGELVQGGNKEVPVEQQVKDLEITIDWMNKAIALDSKNMFLYYLQAKNYALAAELTKEVKYLEKGIVMGEQARELRPGEVRPLWILAQFYLFGSQPAKALEYLEQARALADWLPETNFYLSIVYQNQGDQVKYYEEVDKMIDRGFSFFSADAVKQLIPHYDNLGDLTRLIRLYGQLTALEPTDPNHWQNYVNLLVLDKQYDLALTTLQRASDAIPAFSSRAYVQYQQILKLKEGIAEQAATTTPQ